MTFPDPRRQTPRIRIAGLCTLVSDDDLRPASYSNLSVHGLRMELPFDATKTGRRLQLELELPGTDELMWALAHVTHAHLSPMGGTHPDGQPRFWARVGLEISAGSRRDRRLLRDYVLSTHEAAARAA